MSTASTPATAMIEITSDRYTLGESSSLEGEGRPQRALDRREDGFGLIGRIDGDPEPDLERRRVPGDHHDLDPWVAVSAAPTRDRRAASRPG